MIILSKIIKEKKKAVQRAKKLRPIQELKEDIKRINLRANFKRSIFNNENVSIICEYKPASPSAGEISKIPVESALKIFEKGGAKAVSIITEENFFKSSLDNLKIASRVTRLPLLRKDFIMDEYQIYEARSCGASAVLLLADLYPDLQDGIALCDYLGMNALVECKTDNEINMAMDAGADIIGINNRSLKDFSMDFNRTKELSKYVNENIVLVSESGVKNMEDVEILCSYGVDALLVGTGIMGANGMQDKVEEIVTAAKNTKVNRR